MTSAASGSVSRWDALVRAVAIAVAVAGIASVIGHLAGAVSLSRPFRLGPPLSVDAAVCLTALGMSTFAALGPRVARSAAVIAALGIAAYAGIAVYRHATARLATGTPATSGIDLGTAAALAAQSTTLAIAALRPSTRAPLAITSALTLGVALVTLLAYTLGVRVLAGIGGEMPFLAALALAAHGGGALVWAWHRDAAETGDPMPAWSPLVAAISAGAVFVGFTIAVEGDSALLQTALVLGAAGKLATTVHQHLQERRSDAAARRRVQDARERAEATSAEVQAQRQWLESVLDLAPVPLVLIDPASSRVAFANKAANELARGTFPRGTGATEATAFAYVDPLDRPLAEADTPPARIIRGERLQGADTAVLTPAGRRDLVVHGALLGPMHGQPPIAVLALQDITDLRRAEAATMRLGRLLDEAPTEVYTFDAATLRFVQENAAARRNLGFTSVELQSLGPLDLCPDLERDAFVSLIEPLRTGERDRVAIETVQRRKDGTVYPVEAHIQMSRSESPPVFFALVENVTTRRRIEAERAQLLAAERAALRARDEFLEIAANDLRIPVSLLAMESECLARLGRRAGAVPPARVTHFVESAARHAARLSVIVGDLLDPSRVTGERVQLSLEQVDLSALVCNVAARFGERFALAGSPIEVSASSTVVGLWDRFRLEQVVANLFSNAIKYGAGKPVKIAVEADADVARLRVLDHGVGMTECRVAQIFSLSDRAVSARQYGGVGLGLYLVQRIVDAMGGSIAVESAPDEGSTFTVTLPRRAGVARSA